LKKDFAEHGFVNKFVELASQRLFSPSMLAKHKVVGSTPITRSTFSFLLD
jgi:hypothetical protein